MNEQKTAKELVEEIMQMLGEDLQTEIEYQLRALHARTGVRSVSLGVALLAMGHAILRNLELSPLAQEALQIAAGIAGAQIKVIPSSRAAELTDEEKKIARKLGARIPVIGKA